ncbi:hypothetical protein QA646_22965 (plasmid) [Rhizobium sp. CB3090]|uniref:hypothetical protein n=1 Tax=Rhizobium sp. CB3090 TaxID=3039156 RepID=UPI0024B139F7|nr:hypothetical protein [Rhizobium sp. CB3090]WFU11266.1 hypothetical protein QA646_22965 [Rhizobium sp. CB3090]
MRRREELAMAVGHVRDGEKRVLRQEALISRLEAGGHSSEQALELLDTFNITLDLMRGHLRIIEGEIDAERHLRKLARQA